MEVEDKKKVDSKNKEEHKMKIYFAPGNKKKRKLFGKL